MRRELWAGRVRLSRYSLYLARRHRSIERTRMRCIHHRWELTMTKKSHPGFKKVQSSIEKEGYSKKAAGAILASSTRNASAAAHKANPRLSKVKGK